MPAWGVQKVRVGQMTDAADAVKFALTMPEVAEMYGYPPNRAGFIRCPFHGGGAERTPSLKLYDGQGGFYCYSCHASGTVIDFAMQLFDIPFPEAVKRLNADFSLGLSLEKPNRAKMSRLLQERQSEARGREEAELIRLGLFDLDAKAAVALHDCETAMRDNPPTLENGAPVYPVKWARAAKRKERLLNWKYYYAGLERLFEETGNFPPDVTAPMIRHFIRRGVKIQYHCNGGKFPLWMTARELAAIDREIAIASITRKGGRKNGAE